MATKPTRQQRHACEQLAEALELIAAVARQEPGSGLALADFQEIVRLSARATPAFESDELVARTLARRCRALGLPDSAAELLTLWDAGMPPMEMLLLTDEGLRALVVRLEEEVGNV